MTKDELQAKRNELAAQLKLVDELLHQWQPVAPKRTEEIAILTEITPKAADVFVEVPTVVVGVPFKPKTFGSFGQFKVPDNCHIKGLGGIVDGS